MIVTERLEKVSFFLRMYRDSKAVSFKEYSHATDSGTPCVLLLEGPATCKVPLTEGTCYVCMYPMYIQYYHMYVCTLLL